MEILNNNKLLNQHDSIYKKCSNCGVHVSTYYGVCGDCADDTEIEFHIEQWLKYN